MNKYRSRKTIVDGITFASKREAGRYQQLKALAQSGAITGLELQKRFEIAPPCTIQGRKRPARYYQADFTYTHATGQQVVEDCKGYRTDMYCLKRHLMKALHNIDILET